MAQVNTDSDGLKMAELVKTDPAMQALHFIRLELSLLGDAGNLTTDQRQALTHIYQIAGNAMKTVLSNSKS